MISQQSLFGMNELANVTNPQLTVLTPVFDAALFAELTFRIVCSVDVFAFRVSHCRALQILGLFRQDIQKHQQSKIRHCVGLWTNSVAFVTVYLTIVGHLLDTVAAERVPTRQQLRIDERLRTDAAVCQLFGVRRHRFTRLVSL